MSKTVSIGKKDFGTLCICALRYCHGRRTYMPSLVQGIVMAHFDDLNDTDLRIIAEDEKFQARMNLWGDACDEADWKTFYSALREHRKNRGGEEDETD